MYKIFLIKTNDYNSVVITDGSIAKIYGGEPTGIYNGVDLYAKDAAKKLQAVFKAQEEAGELQTFEELYSPEEMPAEEIAEQLEGLKPIYTAFRPTITIYCNYGVLAAEKRHIYTYGGPNNTATCWDEMTVKIPEGWELYQNEAGEVLTTAPWGWNYSLNDVLAGNKRPEFRAMDPDMNLKIFELEEV